jgi:hypothetical protein
VGLPRWSKGEGCGNDDRELPVVMITWGQRKAVLVPYPPSTMHHDRFGPIGTPISMVERMEAVDIYGKIRHELS